MFNQKWLIVIGFVIGITLGTLISWQISSIRFNKIKNKFIEDKQRQTQTYNDAVSLANKTLEESRIEFADKESLLRAEIQNNTVIHRAVSAGRLYIKPTCPSSDPVQASARIDEASPHTVPTPGRATEEREETFQVINDCAITTLMLNQLQEDIEKQLKLPEH